MNKILTGVLKYIGLFAGLNIILFAFLALTYLISQDQLIEGVTEGFTQINDRGIYEDGKDGYTDLLILSSVFITPKKGENILSMAVTNNVCREGIEYYDPITGMYNLLGNSDNYAPYSNYFVGVTGILKVLFWIFNYKTIKLLLSVLPMIGIVIVSISLFRRYGMRSVASFVTMLVVGNICAYSACITYCIDIVCMLLASYIVLLLYNKKKDEYIPYAFFAVGLITYFVNYWSFPIFSLCIPITIECIELSKREKGLKDSLTELIKSGICWVMGFGLEVVLRLVTAKAMLGSESVSEHLGWYILKESPFDKGSRFGVILKMMGMLFGPFNLLVIVMVMVGLIIASRKQLLAIIRNKSVRVLLLKIIPFVLVVLIPFAWIFVMYNHTHHGFDMYLLTPVVFSVLGVFSIEMDVKNE